MALTYVHDSATIGTTEYFLASDATTKTDQTDAAMLQAWVDVGALAAGDQYRVRVYEKVHGSGATQRTILEAILTGAQPYPFVSPALMVGAGWEVSVTKLAGADCLIGWSLRKAT